MITFPRYPGPRNRAPPLPVVLPFSRVVNCFKLPGFHFSPRCLKHTLIDVLTCQYPCCSYIPCKTCPLTVTIGHRTEFQLFLLIIFQIDTPVTWNARAIFCKDHPSL